MKDIITIIGILLINAINAQNLSKKDLDIKLTESTCECLKGKDISAKNFEMTIGLCLLTSVSKSKEDVKKHYSANYMESMEKIGESVGELMVTYCPEKLDFMFNEEFLNKYVDEDSVSDSDIEVIEDENYEEESYDNESIVAKFISAKEDGFLYVTVKEDSGKTHQLILINPFNNDFLVIDNVLKPNDKIEIHYFDAELYDAKYKKIINCKVIEDIIKL